MKFVFIDIDGTISDIRHRQHLALSGAWDEFHSMMSKDTVRKQVLDFIQLLPEETVISFLTGRPDEYRAMTKIWLEENCCLYEDDDYCALLMRPQGDFSSDPILKENLISEFFRREDIANEFVYAGMQVQHMDEDEIKSCCLILDDRDKVVAHLRDIGYEVWQVNEGTY